MSLISRVIKSFRKLFQFKKSSPKKSKSRTKKVSPKKKVLKTKRLSKIGSSKATVKNKTVKPPASQQKSVKIKPLKSKSDVKPPAGKKVVNKTEEPKGKWVGDITHYFTRIQVIVLEVKNGPLKSGDRIFIKGPKSNFSQPVRSMQIESIEVKIAKKGQIIGLKVEKDVQVGDKVFLLS